MFQVFFVKRWNQNLYVVEAECVQGPFSFFFHCTHWTTCRVLRMSPSGPSPLPLFLYDFSLDLPHHLSFISSLLLSRHSTPFLLLYPLWDHRSPSLTLPPFFPPTPCDWVWLSSLHRGRWGHKAAGGAPESRCASDSLTHGHLSSTYVDIGTHTWPFIWALLILC